MCLLGLQAHWQISDSSDLPLLTPQCMGEEGLNPIWQYPDHALFFPPCCWHVHVTYLTCASREEKVRIASPEPFSVKFKLPMISRYVSPPSASHKSYLSFLMTFYSPSVELVRFSSSSRPYAVEMPHAWQCIYQFVSFHPVRVFFFSFHENTTTEGFHSLSTCPSKRF